MGTPARAPDRFVYSLHRPLRPRSAGNLINATSALFAALTGIAYASLAPVVMGTGVRLNLMLVAVVVVTAQFGLSAGALWAFVGGMAANLLIPVPLGSVPLSLLAVSALVAGAARLIGSRGWVFVALAAAGASAVADLVALGVLAFLGSGGSIQGSLDGTLGLMIRGAITNAILAALVLFPVRIGARRFAADGNEG